MAVLFYIILVIFSKQVTWSWLWFFVSLIFSAEYGRTIYKYKYTRNPDLDEEEVDEAEIDELE